MARNLLLRATEQLGIDQRVWIVTETGPYGSAATGGLFPAATDAIEHVSSKIDFSIPREDTAHRSGRSKVSRLSGKKEVKFSFESYIVPSAPNGSSQPQLPDSHPMLLSAFGAVDVTDPATIAYSLARVGAYSFRMLEEGTHFSRLAVGCVADSVTFSLPGDGKAMLKFEGFGQDAHIAGQSTLAEAITGSAVAASVTIQTLTYTADATGQSGNSITIAYTAGATAGSEVVTVTGNAISVQIATGVSTGTQVKAAVDASIAAAALVNVTGASGTAQTAPVTATYLTGGLGTNDFKVASGHGGRFDVGSYVDVIDKDDGNTLKNTGRLISARGTGVNTDIFTVSGAVLSASDAADIVIGAAPTAYTATASENALLGLKGSFSTAALGTIDADLLSAEIAIKNNYTPRANSYGKSAITGFLSDKRREVTVKLDILLTKDNFEFYSNNKVFTVDNLTIVLQPQDIPAPQVSDATGRTVTFRLPRVEFNVPSLEQPSDGPIKLTIEGTALSTDVSTANAEMTMSIT